MASCFSGEPIETLVVWNDWGARTEVTFYDRDRAALTLMLPFAEVDRLIAALQGARAIVNHQSGKVMLPRSSRGKLQMVVTEVNEESLRGLPSEPWANPVELGLYPHFG